MATQRSLHWQNSVLVTLRRSLTLFFAVSAFVGMTSGVSAQSVSKDLRTELSSNDTTRVMAALSTLENVSTWSSIECTALLEASESRNPATARLVNDWLKRHWARIRSFIADSLANPQAETLPRVLRLVVAVRTREFLPQIRSLILHGTPAIEEEATRTLLAFGLESEDVWAASTRKTLWESSLVALQQGRPSAAELEARHAANLLFYLAYRKIPDTINHLGEVLAGPFAEARRIAAKALTVFDVELLLEVCRQKVQNSVGEDTRFYLDLITSQKRAKDRLLGLATWTRIDNPEPDLVEFLQRWLADSAAWLLPTPSAENTHLVTNISIHKDDVLRGISLKLSRSVDVLTSESLNGVTSDHPLDEWLIGLPFYDSTLQTTGDTTTIRFRRLDGRPLNLSFGIGSNEFGIWFGREIVRAQVATLSFDSRGHLHHLALADESGVLKGELFLSKWEKMGTRWAPTSMEFRSPASRMILRREWTTSQLAVMSDAIFLRRVFQSDVFVSEEILGRAQMVTECLSR